MHIRPPPSAAQLVHSGIMAGINNDLGSGGSVDLMVITKEGYKQLRNYDRPNERAPRAAADLPAAPTPRARPSRPLLSHLFRRAHRAANASCVRAYALGAGKYRKPDGYKFPRGTAKVLSKEFLPLSSLVTIETEQVPAAMQVG